MLPNRVIYKGKEFETIGFIKLNNGSFLILRNGEDIVGLDLSKINLNLNLKFEIKEATKVELVLIHYIVEAIKNDIRSGKYQNKEDLKKDIVDLNKYINTHKELLGNMKQLDFKDDVVDKTITGLLSYFDEVMKDAPLNLEGITSFQVDGKSYIKYKDENGQVKIMDDNVDNRNFVEQFKTKQNESKYFKQEDGKESALNIAEDMNKYQKTSVGLTDVETLDDASNKQALSNKAMQKYDEKVDKSIVGNAETGIYYDENNEQLLTADKKDNKVVISEIKEATADGTNSVVAEETVGVDYPPYNEEVVTQYLAVNRTNKINLSAFINKYLYDLTPTQIDYLINNYNLDPNQVAMLNEQKNLKLTDSQTETQKEKPKTKIFTLNDNRKPNAAFVDTLLLSFVVGLVSGMYLVFLILIIMS